MDFPELSFNTYDNRDSISQSESCELATGISGIDSVDVNEAIVEDVCLLDNVSQTKITNNLGSFNAHGDSSYNVAFDLSTNSTFEPGYFDTGDADDLKSLSSQLPAVLKARGSSCAKQTPAILVLADSTDSSSSRRGPPGGDPNSKNAIAARDNRLKKKKYIAELENTVKELKTENISLRKESKSGRKLLVTLQQEVHYLKGVIANQSTLAALLKSVSQTPGINLSSSVNQPSTSSSEKNDDVHLKTVSEVSSNLSYKANRIRNLRSGSSKKEQSSSCISSLAHSKAKQCKRKSCVTEKESSVCGGKKFLKMTNPEDLPINVDMETDSDSSCESSAEHADVTTEDCSPSGICFHVSGKKVSLELCSYCNSTLSVGMFLDCFQHLTCCLEQLLSPYVCRAVLYSMVMSGMLRIQSPQFTVCSSDLMVEKR